MFSLDDLARHWEINRDRIERRCNMHFPHLHGADRQDARANAIGLAWKYAARLVQLGKVDHENVNYWIDRCTWYGVKQTRAGRTPQSAARRRDDVFDHLTPFELGPDDVSFFVGDRTPVPDQVSFRVDVLEDFFSTRLTVRQRMIAKALMDGRSTTEVARAFGVTPGAISQFRARFKLLLDRFFGE